jgi:hypothetical protein
VTLRLGLLLLSVCAASEAAAAPRRDFYASFSDNVLRSESGFLQSAHGVCGYDGCGVQRSGDWLLESQLRALSRAAERTIDEVYAIRSLSRLLTERPTDARSAGVAAAAGAVILFVDGVHAKTTVAGYQVALELASGRRLRADSSARVASVEVQRRGQPLSVTVGWGRQVPLFGARYALRY